MIIKELVDHIYIEKDSSNINVYPKRDVYVRGYENAQKAFIYLIDGNQPLVSVDANGNHQLIDSSGNVLSWNNYRELTYILANFVFLLPSYHNHANKHLLDSLTDGGAGDRYLADDGVYKPITVHVDQSFLDLNDTPNDYIGMAGMLLGVNATEDGLEFGTLTVDVSWGQISGTLSNQADLQAELDLKEDWLANPSIDGMILYSDITGHRYWDLPPAQQTIRWGDIEGTLSNQLDLQNALNLKADVDHDHTVSDITDFEAEVANHIMVKANTAARHSHANKALLDSLEDNGPGDEFLSNDGTYKPFSGLTEFIQLLDTPSDYSGNAGKAVVVNVSEDGVVFGEVVGGSAEWGNITGTLANQTDLQDALDAKANVGHSHLFKDLADTPGAYVGQQGRLVKVNATEDGLIFGDPSGTTVSWGDISGTLANQTDLQNALNAKADVNHSHSFSDLSDTPGNYTGADGNILVVDESGAVLVYAELTTDIVAEGARLYFTDARVESNTVVAANAASRHDHANKSLLDSLVDNGDGSLFLANDGTYKAGGGQSTFEVKSPAPFTAADGQIDFVMPSSVADEIHSTVYVSVNGALQQYQEDFSIVTTTVTRDTIRFVEALDTDDEVLVSYFHNLGDLATSASVAWGEITGTLSAQTDLQDALDAKAASDHDHTISDVSDFQSGVSANTDVQANTAARHSHSNSSALGNVIDSGDGSLFLSDDGTYKAVGGGSVSWGGITGTLSDQDDLQDALDAKAASDHDHVASDITDFEAAVPGVTDVVKKSSSDTLVGQMNMAVVTDMPGTPDENTIYFVVASTASCPDPSTIPEPGTRILVADFFDELDYQNFAGLSEVERFKNCGAYVEAGEALLDYLRSRPLSEVNWWYDPHDYQSDNGNDYGRDISNDACVGIITVKGVTYHFDYDNQSSDEYHIDWTHTDASTSEWNWQLNRMDWWRSFGWNYWYDRHNGDSPTDPDVLRYPREFINQITKWLGQVPRPDDDGNVHPSSWRTIECGIRLGDEHWPDQFNRLLHAPEFDAQALVYFLMGIYENEIHLDSHHGGGNWLMTENAGRYISGGLFPEFSKASAWRSDSVTSLHGEVDVQFFTDGDGGHFAMSGTYGVISVEESMNMYRYASMYGRLDELPTDFIDSMELLLHRLVTTMMPNWEYQNKNDGNSEPLWQYMNRWYQSFPSRPDFEWVATRGASGTEPSYTSYDNTWTGYVAFRDSWDTDTNYIHLDFGDFFGNGPHRHGDINSIVVWSHGIQMLYDGDGGLYDSTVYREYAVSAFSHNTLTIDRNTQSTGIEDDYPKTGPSSHVTEFGEFHDYARHLYDRGYATSSDPYSNPSEFPANHTREALYLKEISAMVVVDRLENLDNSSHHYEQRWHMEDLTVENGASSNNWVGIESGDIGLGVLGIDLEGNLTVSYHLGEGSGASHSREIYGYAYLDGPGLVEKPECVNSKDTDQDTVFLTILFMTDTTGNSYSALISSVNVINTSEAEVHFVDGSHIKITLASSAGMTVELYDTSGTLYRTITVG